MFKKIIFIYLIAFIAFPIFAFAGLEYRKLHDKYAAEINKKIEIEFIKQKLCVSSCKSSANTLWTFEPRKNEFEASFFIPKDKKINRAKIIDIFSEIHARDNINISISFYDGSHKEYRNHQAKKVSMIKFSTYH